MDEIVENLIGGITEEVKEIKSMVKETERHVKYDPLAWSKRSGLAQRFSDANLLGEEPQKELPDL